MNSQHYYKELNINEGASLTEVKAAFRKVAKTYHPDVKGLKADADKFRLAYEAYQLIIKNLLTAKAEVQTELGLPFRFLSQKHIGLDIYYELALVMPLSKKSFKLVLPQTSHQACPRCLGQGQTLSRLNHGNVYRPETCSRCHGEGRLSSQSHLSVTVTPEMAKQGKFRLRQAGDYLPSEGKRGDLIVHLYFEQKLSSQH